MSCSTVCYGVAAAAAFGAGILIHAKGVPDRIDRSRSETNDLFILAVGALALAAISAVSYCFGRQCHR